MKENLERVKIYLENLGYEICFISLYGSQNYGLDIHTKKYQSDIDYKAVCLPTLKDLINQTKPISKTLEFEGGQIDLKDIRLFTENLVKCNPVNIEAVYSDYNWYTKEFEEIVKIGRELPFDLMPLFVKSAYGQAMEKVKAFSHPYPSLVDKIEKYGYNPKQLCHIVRLENLCDNLINNGIIKFKYKGIERDNIIKIKKGYYCLELAIALREINMRNFQILRDLADKKEMKFENKNKIIELSKKIIENNIIYSIEKDKIINDWYKIILDNENINKAMPFDWSNYSK